MRSRRPFASVIVAVLVGLVSLTEAQAPKLRVLSSNGVRAVVEELQPRIEQRAGRQLDVTFGTSAATKQRIMDGEPFDLAILTADAIDELIAGGKLAKPSRVALGRSGIGVGMRAGAAKLDIRTPDALKRVLAATRSLTYASDGASRPHIAKMLDTLGIADAVNAKTILEQGSVRAAERVTKGDADLIITLISEIVPVPGLELVGPLPQQFQNYVSFAAAVAPATRHADAARGVAAYLATSEVAPIFVAKGIEK